jgi:hypothetical protein
MKLKNTILLAWAALVLTSTYGLGQAGELLISDPVASADPVIKPGKKVTLIGKLKGGMMAIGGETTGWQLIYTTSKGATKIEVDMKAIEKTQTFDGAKVTVTGTIITKKYIERGSVLILKAESVVAGPKT